MSVAARRGEGSVGGVRGGGPRGDGKPGGGVPKWGWGTDGGQTAVSSGKMPGNIDPAYYISTHNCFLALGCRVYHFFGDVLSNLSSSHRISEVTYSTPDPGQPWERGCWGHWRGVPRGTLEV